MKSKVYIVALMLVLSIFVSSIGWASPQSYNFNFMDEDIRVVLHTLSRISDVDMIIDDSIKGNITMKLSNVTFATALDLITSAKGLAYRQVGNSYIIESADMGMTEVIKLQYTRAVDIKKTIEPIATSLKLKMEIDEVSNSLIVTGSPAGNARIKEILKSIDVLQQQVTIEAKIVSVNKNNLKNLGVDWKFDPGPQTAEYEREKVTSKKLLFNNDGSPMLDNSGNQATASVEGFINKVTRDLTKGVIQFGRGPEGFPYMFYYQAQISALISNGNGKLLASPKVTAINGKEARVFIGDHIPVLTETITDGKSSTTTSYVDAGIKLLYTPTITADGTITAKVRTEVSTPTLISEIRNYKITTREAETTVNMKDGETMVIAGLIGSEESKNINKVPFLSNIPILGALFKSVHNSKNETEVIIFLTARIVK